MKQRRLPPGPPPPAPPKPLTRREREARIQSALLRIQSTSLEVRAAVLELCSELLATFFAGDPERMWQQAGVRESGFAQLLERLRGGEYGFSAATLSRALRVAALDQLLAGDRWWPALEGWAKEALLVLPKLEEIRAGAKQAVTMKTDPAHLRDWITARLELTQRPRQRRRRHVTGLRRPLEQLVDTFSVTETIDDLAGQAAALDAAERGELLERVRAAREGLGRFLAAVGPEPAKKK